MMYPKANVACFMLLMVTGVVTEVVKEETNEMVSKNEKQNDRLVMLEKQVETLVQYVASKKEEDKKVTEQLERLEQLVKKQFQYSGIQSGVPDREREAFLAIQTTDQYVSVGSTVQFTTIRYRMGIGYRASQSAFRCTNKGVHVFYTSFPTRSGRDWGKFVIVKNGQPLSAFYKAYEGNNYSAMAVTDCERNDDIWVKLEAGHGTLEVGSDYTGQAHFVGFRLY